MTAAGARIHIDALDADVEPGRVTMLTGPNGAIEAKGAQRVAVELELVGLVVPLLEAPPRLEVHDLEASVVRLVNRVDASAHDATVPT